MLNSFRSFAGSFLIKVLMGFLVLSFGMWGVGDMLRQSGHSGNVASVGGEKISQAEFAGGVRNEIENLRRMLGKQFSPDLAVSLQIPEHVLQMMVQKKLLQQEGYDIGVIASDAEILRRITTSPGFQDEKGQFNKAQFENALRRSGTSEKKYIELLRGDIASEQLTDIFSAPLPRLDIAVRTLYQSREALRTATVYTIPAALARNIAEPTPEQLDAYHKAHAAEFTIPEYRKLTYFTVTAQDVPGAALSEDELATAYSKFTNSIEDAFAGGSTLAEVAKQFHLKVDGVDSVSRDGKMPDGSPNSLVPAYDRFLEVAFKTDEKSESQLISTKGGKFYALRVEAVTPEHVRPLAEVRAQVVAGWQKQQRAAQMDKLAVEISQKFAAKDSREATIKQYGLTTTTVSGLKPGNKGGEGLPNEMLDELFKHVAGQSTDAYPGKDGNYLIAVLTAVTPGNLPEVGSEKYYELTQATHSALSKAFENELLEQYMLLLERNHEVSVNQNVLKAMMADIKE